MSKNILIYLFIVCSLTVLGGNILKNTQLIRSDDGQFSDWQIQSNKKSDINRVELPSFLGLPEAMYHLEGNGHAVIRQKNVPVTPNTWYLLSCWYISQTNNHPHGNLRISVTTPDGKTISDQRFGAIDQWTKARMFFYNENQRVVDFVVNTGATGDWKVGGFVLSPLENRDYTSEILLDGNFENGVPGGVPSDFIRWGKESSSPYIVANKDFPSGEKNMAVKVSPNSTTTLTGPGFLASEGDTVEISAWAKADKPGVTLLLGAQAYKAGKMDGTALTGKWQKIKSSFTLDSSTPYQHDACLLKTAIKVRSQKEAEVYVDNVELNVIPPQTKNKMKRRKNPIMNSSFEAGLAGWNRIFTKTARKELKVGTVAIDSTTAAEGTCSLKVETPNAPSKSSLHRFMLSSAYFDIETMVPYTISFWAKASKKGTSCRPFLDNPGKSIQLDTEWRRYHCVITPQSAKNGRNNFRLRLPLNGCTYWIDGIQVEKGETPSDYEPDGKLEIGGVFTDMVYPFFQFGDKVNADIYLCSRFDKEKELIASWEALDYRQQIVGKHTEKIKLPAHTTQKVPMRLFDKLKGQFIVNFKLSDPESGKTAESPLVYGIFPKARKVSTKDSWFGIHDTSLNAARGGSPETTLNLAGGSFDDLLKTLRFCGFNWLRNHAVGAWMRTERKKGEFDWAYNDAIQAMVDNGFDILVYLGVFAEFPDWSDSGRPSPYKLNRWDPKSPLRNYPKVSDWKDYVEAFVKQYKGRIDAITIMGETHHSPKEYIDLVKVVYPAIKRIDPNMKVVLAGSGLPAMQIDADDNSHIARMMKRGLYNYLDIYSGHFYPSETGLRRVTKIPNELAINNKYGTLLDLLKQQIAYLRKTQGNKPIWNTESGVTTPTSVPWMRTLEHTELAWFTPEIQAARTVRWGICTMASGISKHMHFMFSLHYFTDHGYDVVNYDMSPKVVLPALSQFAKMLDVSTLKKHLKINLHTWVYIFEVEGKTVAVYWNYTLENKKPETLHLSLASDDVKMEDMMGNPIASNKGTLPLTASPIYLISTKLSPEELAAKFEKAKVSGGKACEMRVSAGNIEGKLAVVGEIQNMSPETLKNVKINVDMPQNWKRENAANTIVINSLPPSTTTTKSIALKSIANDPTSKIKFSTTIKGRTYTAESRNLFVAKIPKAPSHLSSIADLENIDSASTPSITLNDESQVLEPKNVENKRPNLENWLKKKKPVSGEFWLYWTSEKLYLCCDIKDDYVVNTAEQGYLYLGDSIELYLDFFPARNMSSAKYEDHQIKLLFAPASGKYPARWQAEKAGTPIYSFKYIDLSKLKLNSQKTAKGYRLNAELPLQSIALSPDKLIGLNIHLISNNRVSRKPLLANTTKTGTDISLMWNIKATWNKPQEMGFGLLTPQ